CALDRRTAAVASMLRWGQVGGLLPLDRRCSSHVRGGGRLTGPRNSQLPASLDPVPVLDDGVGRLDIGGARAVGLGDRAERVARADEVASGGHGACSLCNRALERVELLALGQVRAGKNLLG